MQHSVFSWVCAEKKECRQRRHSNSRLIQFSNVKYINTVIVKHKQSTVVGNYINILNTTFDISLNSYPAFL